MKKKMMIITSIVIVIFLLFLIGTGFQKRTDVVLGDYSVSENGKEMYFDVYVSSSMGYTRGFKDKGGGVKPHYLTFYSTFGGLNSSFDAVNSFVLELGKNDTEIYFNRPNGGYELVLVKDEESSRWIRPREESEQWDLIPMVMVNGEIYLDTGHESTLKERCGLMDGEITSEVGGSEQPTEDNQSNFGIGYGYQYGSQEGTIEIYMNDKWWIFATEEVREKLQFSQIGNTEETITYKGKEYKKSELSKATLQWLNLSEEDRMLSSYYPPEFMIIKELWGITLTVENVRPSGVTIRCTQSGGTPTGELNTGSWYILENWTQEYGWKEMPYVFDGEIGWTSEAWLISMNASSEWEVNWEWLYGQIPAGKYRIGKEIMDFRGPGDFDQKVYYAEFVID